MKTINFELSKRLAPYLKNIETEFIWRNKVGDKPFISLGYFINTDMSFSDYKTLTIEEVLEFLGKTNVIVLIVGNGKYSLTWGRDEIDYCGTGFVNSLLEAIEKLFNILFDNNLLNEPL